MDNLILISNILFNSLVNSTTNYGPLSLITLSDSLCNFHTLSLNNLTSPSADILSVVVMKCIIFNNLSYTTKIVSFPATNSNFVIKSTVKYVHTFSSTLFAINFSADTSVLFFIL